MLFGPESLLKDRRGAIPIKSKDGSIEHRRVIWNSKPFDFEGVPHCYAKAEEKRRCVSCGGYHLRNDVRNLNGEHRDIRWCRDQSDCDCAGLLTSQPI